MLWCLRRKMLCELERWMFECLFAVVGVSIEVETILSLSPMRLDSEIRVFS
jgi:hypothetical protein